MPGRGTIPTLLASCVVQLLADAGEAISDWKLGGGGQTCHEVCLQHGRECSEDAWPDTLEELQAIARELNYHCERFQEGSIRYDPSATGPYCGWMGDMRNRPENRCTAKPPISAQRFCFCGSADGQNPIIDVATKDKAALSVTSEPFDCAAGLSNRVVGWSVYKMVWCCRHRGVGCEAGASAPYDCDAGYNNWRLGWSHNKTVWCCAHAGRACPKTSTTSQAFDCQVGSDNWELAWSDGKKSFCCSHQSKGCSTTATLDIFDCEAGLLNFEAGWSQEKKTWCCLHEQRGCPVSTTPASFDCNAGLANWKLGWSLEKMEWCCKMEQAGKVELQDGADLMQHHHSCAWLRTVAGGFDCQVALNNWLAAWSDEKKEWCCGHEKLGCHTD